MIDLNSVSSVSSMNGSAVSLLFVVPLLLGTGLIIAALRYRQKWVRWFAGTGGVAFVVVFLVTVSGSAPYLWALHLESKWSPAKPRSEVELESYLSLYSKKEIQPSESAWGCEHRLQAGERMIQYLLLWSAPLDVVYSSDGELVAIYTSYE